jgi:drug/metabolite transporter (DMT)-like permease
MSLRVVAPASLTIPKFLTGTALILPSLSLLWGSSYLWISILNGAFDPATLILTRVCIAAAVLAAVLWLKGGRLPAFGKGWLHILVAAVAADLAPMFMLVWAQNYVASSVAAVLNATIPLFTLLIAALVFRSERITGNRMIGILLGFIGVVLLSGVGSGSSGSFINPGVVAVMVSSVFYGFGFVYARRYVRGDPFGIVVLQMLMSIVLVAPLAMLTGDVNTAAISPAVLLAMVGQGALSSGLGYIVYYIGLERLGPTSTSYGTYLSPVVAIALGWVILGERIGLVGLLGILIVIAGILTAAGLLGPLAAKARSGLDRALGYELPEAIPVAQSEDWTTIGTDPTEEWPVVV